MSTLDQCLAIQQAALKAAGCAVIRAETASATRRDGRTELQVLLDLLHTGDTLVVTRIDRLARLVKDLQDIVHELKARGSLCAPPSSRSTLAARHAARSVTRSRSKTAGPPAPSISAI